ncbi:hypothetical protein L7F22_059414 [Adiantum nelumboides]|nr:hypothetical protein [Adiantum nelumboides]
MHWMLTERMAPYTSQMQASSLDTANPTVLEGRPNGRLLKLDPSTGATSVFATGLYFPNGVAVSKDNSFLVVSETSKVRCQRLWLKGSNKGKLEKFIDNLPGYPENIHKSDRGTFWIGLVSLGMQVTRYIQFAVQQAAKVENHLTSVERINAYTNLATEADPNTAPGVIEEDWPSRGKVEFVKYTMIFRVDLTAILNEVSFKIHAKEKIGIFGRTGVGKSSLAAALFRMVENERCGGDIFIDGINIKFV